MTLSSCQCPAGSIPQLQVLLISHFSLVARCFALTHIVGLYAGCIRLWGFPGLCINIDTCVHLLELPEWLQLPRDITVLTV